MATINFSVPEDVKAAFNETFSHQNKSAVIVELMREAVARARSRQHNATPNGLPRHADAAVLSESREAETLDCVLNKCIVEANDPDTKWLSHEEVFANLEARYAD